MYDGVEYEKVVGDGAQRIDANADFDSNTIEHVSKRFGSTIVVQVMYTLDEGGDQRRVRVPRLRQRHQDAARPHAMGGTYMYISYLKETNTCIQTPTLCGCV